MQTDCYTCRVTLLGEDGEHVGLCAEFPFAVLAGQDPGAAESGDAAALVISSDRG